MTKLDMRCAAKTDIDIYFRWANEVRTRKNSICTEPIDFETHKSWFYRKLQDVASFLYIVEKDALPFGQVRFDLNADVATVNFSLDECFRGQGVGGELLKIALRELSCDCKYVNYINAIVKADNKASNRIFLNLGFRLFESNQITGLNIYRATLSRLG